MFDKRLLVFSVVNYVVGLNLYKYLIVNGLLDDLGMLFGPFIWLGLMVTVLQTMSAIRKDMGEYRNSETKEKVIPNLILLFLNQIICDRFVEFYRSLQ